MNIKKWSFLFFVSGFALFPAIACAAAPESAAPTRVPNIVLVVSDDGGWADFGFNGSPDFKTPHLDQLARQGTVFGNGYVTASVCSPSRAGLLTGRYQTRFGHELNLTPALEGRLGVPLSEKTLADRLKAAGYATAAFGKWHLGAGEGYRPADRGFEHTYTFLSGSRGYMPENKESDNDRTMRLNGQPVRLNEYLTDAIARQTAEYIRREKDNAKPLFIYVAFNCPHSPLQAKPGYEDRFHDLKGARKTIAAMQTSLDEGVGEIVKSLRETGRWDNTLFWFINDNGAATYGKFNNGGLRNNKGTLFDGGVKVAWFVHCPREMNKGRVCREPVLSLDIAATSLAAAGVGEANRKDLEGRDLLPYLSGRENAPPARPLFWRQKEAGTVRSEGWKLILLKGKPVQLFDLNTDPSERNNLIAGNEGMVKKLQELYLAWDKENVAPLWRAEEPDRNSWMYERTAPWEANETWNGKKGMKEKGRSIKKEQ